jgi:hypothetical protein
MVEPSALINVAVPVVVPVSRLSEYSVPPEALVPQYTGRLLFWPTIITPFEVAPFAVEPEFAPGKSTTLPFVQKAATFLEVSIPAT